MPMTFLSRKVACQKIDCKLWLLMMIGIWPTAVAAAAASTLSLLLSSNKGLVQTLKKACSLEAYKYAW